MEKPKVKKLAHKKDDLKPEKDVKREEGQISFKDALKKAIVPRKKKN
ncbi:hypothetical protein [Fibrisoma montanum]|nr:hypothetical protein [Fibrisoma montanum]